LAYEWDVVRRGMELGLSYKDYSDVGTRTIRAVGENATVA